MLQSTFRWLLGLVVCVISSGPVLAQEIAGQVRYSRTGQAAFNILVRCEGTGFSGDVFTDRSGNFSFRVTPGSYNISIHLPGFRDEWQSVTLIDYSAREYLLIRLKDVEASAKSSPPTAPAMDPNVPAAARKEFEKGEAEVATGKKDRLEAAVQHFEKALNLYPKFVQAQLGLGTAYMDLQQFDKAEQALKKTLELDSKAANALFALGEIYLRQKKDEEAEKVVLQGLEIENRSFQGHLTLARVYWDMASKLKDDTQARPTLEKAYDQVKKALDLNPNLAQAHLLKGNLLLRVRRAADAQHEYEEYLRLEPKGAFAEQARVTVEKIKKALESQPKP